MFKVLLASIRSDISFGFIYVPRPFSKLVDVVVTPSFSVGDVVVDVLVTAAFEMEISLLAAKKAAFAVAVMFGSNVSKYD